MTWLAVDRKVVVSTHRQALSALLFLYRQVLGLRLPWMESIGRPQRKPRLPVVLLVAEVVRVLALLQSEHRVLAHLRGSVRLSSNMDPGMSSSADLGSIAHSRKVCRNATTSSTCCADNTGTPRHAPATRVRPSMRW